MVPDRPARERHEGGSYPTPAPTDALVEDLQNDQLNTDTAPAEEAPQPEGEQPAEEGDAQPAEDSAESTEDTADSESTAE